MIPFGRRGGSNAAANADIPEKTYINIYCVVYVFYSLVSMIVGLSMSIFDILIAGLLYYASSEGSHRFITSFILMTAVPFFITIDRLGRQLQFGMPLFSGPFANSNILMLCGMAIYIVGRHRLEGYWLIFRAYKQFKAINQGAAYQPMQEAEPRDPEAGGRQGFNAFSGAGRTIG